MTAPEKVIQDLEALAPRERLQVILEVWAGLDRENDGLELTDAEYQELERRWACYAAGGSGAGEWPRDVVDLAGAWLDLPTAEGLRDEAPADVEREAP